MSSEYPNEPFEEDYRDDEEESTHKGVFSGRAFYAVLAICLVAVGGVAAATFIDNMNTAPLESATDNPAATRVVSAPTRGTTIAAVAAPTAAVTTVNMEAVDAPTAANETKPTGENTDASASTLFVLPIGNEILAGFSSEPLYSETMGDYRAHTAIDFTGSDNQSVRAMAQGTVTEINEDPLWGNCLSIDHGGGIVSRYCGVTTTLSEGEVVDVGEEIGSLSGVPCESLLSPHLHLELYQNGTAVDASTLLGGQVSLSDDLS